MKWFCRFWALPALTVLVLVAAAPVRAAEGSATLAHIKLSGSLDESPVADTPFGPKVENFQTKLDRIKKAKTDPKIQGLYLQLDGLAVGWGKVDELRRAIADFRAAGKKAVAYLDAADTKDYLVALACDRVCLPEGGMFVVTGLRSEVTFYKDMFDKIGLKADILQMGDYKGAPEPFLRNNMSPQLRKQLESVLDDYYDKGLVETIVKSRPGRKWTAEKVKQLIDGAPYTTKKAAELGLVDFVAYPDEMQKELAKLLDIEKVTVSRNYGQAKPETLNLSSPFALISAMEKLFAPPAAADNRKPKVAVIYAVGAIASGKGGDSLLGGSVVGSDTMVAAIRQAEKDPTVKAIVLRVDSPGGSSLASDLIWNELNRSKKPVVASMGDTAASGGYYISMAAKKIYAEPGTLTGSIGVFGGKLVLGGVFEKLYMHTEIISRGANAGIFSTETPFSDSERKAMKGLLQDIYDQFIDKALAGRKKAGVQMTRKELLDLAGGRIWTGRQAKANKLVDELGTLADALAAAREMAGMKKDETELLILPKPRSFLDRLMESQLDVGASAADAQLLRLVREYPDLARHLRAAEALLQMRSGRSWLMVPYRFEVR